MLNYTVIHLNAYRELKEDGVVLCLIATHAKSTGKCYASVDTMAAELGVSSRTIQRSRKFLVENGYIEKVGMVGHCMAYALTDKAIDLFNNHDNHDTLKHDNHVALSTPNHDNHVTQKYSNNKIQNENMCVKEKDESAKKKESVTHTVLSNVSLEDVKAAFNRQEHPWKKGNTAEKFFAYMVANNWQSANGRRYKDLSDALRNWVDWTVTKAQNGVRVAPADNNSRVAPVSAERKPVDYKAYLAKYTEVA